MGLQPGDIGLQCWLSATRRAGRGGASGVAWWRPGSTKAQRMSVPGHMGLQPGPYMVAAQRVGGTGMHRATALDAHGCSLSA
eukprot:scaffold63819_cov54-Phaeocystis_antarctica.AAC.1